MGNSLSGSSGQGGNKDKSPSNTKYPLTVNNNYVQDGHFVGFYNGLTVDQINDVCKSMNGVATITDLTIIVSGAHAAKKNISTKYFITNIKVRESEKPPSTENATADAADDKENADEKPAAKNDFGIQLDANYLMVISTVLLQEATAEQITLKRSTDEKYVAVIKIGSQFAKYTEDYFDAYITDDLTEMKSSSDPINLTMKNKIFQELATVPCIYFNIKTMQMFYNARYLYASVCKLTTLSNGMKHIKTVSENENVIGIYYYDKKNILMRHCLKKYVYTDDTFELNHGDTYYVFTVGGVNANSSNNTISFRNRTLSLTSSMSDFALVFSGGNGDLKPKDISRGYQLSRRLFIGDVVDNITQIFPPDQTIQLKRSDFQLYIGYIEPSNEIDIIGSLLNAVNLPKNKFILYPNTNVFGSYSLPKGLYKTSNNGITNIEDLKDGVNVSQNYYLTLGVSSSTLSTKDYDIVNPHGGSLNVSTLRRNEVKSKQALLVSHTGDMKSMGVYIPDSQLLLPAAYANDDKLVIVFAMEVTPTAVWNMAKNLLHKYERKNWLLYFSLLKNFKLGECTGFTSVAHDNNMILLYPDTIEFSVARPDTHSFTVTTKVREHRRIFIFSQHYIALEERNNYIGAFSVYPSRVPSSVGESHKYKYSIVQNLSYIDYNDIEVQYSTSDAFIGGLSNTMTVYADVNTYTRPTINQRLLQSGVGIYIDYFPTMVSDKILKSYMDEFSSFMKQGSNGSIIKYCCLMRVRKEWLKGVTPDPQLYQVIEGKNKEYVLVAMLGGTTTRYTYNKNKHCLQLDQYPTLFFDSDAAQSKKAQTDDVYIEDPLTEYPKAYDELRNINLPLELYVQIADSPITSYEKRDGIFLHMREKKVRIDDITPFIVNGSISQPDMSITRHTFIGINWIYFLYYVATLKKVTQPAKTNSLLFLYVDSFTDRNLESPALGDTLETYLKKDVSDGKPSPFQTHRVIYDSINKLYIVTNVDVIIERTAKFYSFNNTRMYLNSKWTTFDEEMDDKDMLLDILNDTFKIKTNSSLYRPNNFSIRMDENADIFTYAQMDKMARQSLGVTVKTDNIFWNSISCFVFINDLEKNEIKNLIELFGHLSVNLDNFFVVSTVSFDNTTPVSWFYDRCVVIPGNEMSKISITDSKSNKFYYVKVTDLFFKDYYMKFGVWKTTDPPTSMDITDVDFIINKSKGIKYENNVHVLSNERIDIANDYMQFNFPEETLTSYTKFVDFTTNYNKYILFARPVPKKELKGVYISGVVVLEIEPAHEDAFIDFSEIINLVVQWRALTKNTLHRIIIHLVGDSLLERPSQHYKLEIDSLVYSTEDFTFTENANVVIYPKVEYDAAAGAYVLEEGVLYLNPLKEPPSNYNNSTVFYEGPSVSENKIVARIGAQSAYKRATNFRLSYVNMNMYVTETITK